MQSNVERLLDDVFSEAKLMCGSEGLFQSVFYHHARRYFPAEKIIREYSVESGNIDFVIEDDEVIHAFEIKGGANGHRNSLNKMKEVEKEGKGLGHDLKKLSEFQQANSKCVTTWLVCIDLKPLRIAFNDEDVNKYSTLAISRGTKMAYLSQLDDFFVVFDKDGKKRTSLKAVDNIPDSINPHDVLMSPLLWNGYFKETRRVHGLECVHVGQFYHALRLSGLNWNQCASEIFFNCNKHGTRSYYMPDFAVFGGENAGQFQLFGDHKRIIENDQFKLPYLTSILEFKGGTSFEGQTVSKKKNGISIDVDKLANKIRPRIQTAMRDLGISNKYGSPSYIMVITDIDPKLREFINTSREEYKGIIDIKWAADINA